MKYNGKLLALVIRKRRLELNYSQDYIAAKLGMSQNAYSKLELGHTGITIGKFMIICESLDIGMSDLLKRYSQSVHQPND